MILIKIPNRPIVKKNYSHLSLYDWIDHVDEILNWKFMQTFSVNKKKLDINLVRFFIKIWNLYKIFNEDSSYISMKKFSISKLITTNIWFLIDFASENIQYFCFHKNHLNFAEIIRKSKFSIVNVELRHTDDNSKLKLFTDAIERKRGKSLGEFFEKFQKKLTYPPNNWTNWCLFMMVSCAWP